MKNNASVKQKNECIGRNHVEWFIDCISKRLIAHHKVKFNQWILITPIPLSETKETHKVELDHFYNAHLSFYIKYSMIIDDGVMTSGIVIDHSFYRIF